MRKEVAEKWVRALHSGEYQQTKGALHTVDGQYCCLGVLCELYAKEKKILNPWKTQGGYLLEKVFVGGRNGNVAASS